MTETQICETNFASAKKHSVDQKEARFPLVTQNLPVLPASLNEWSRPLKTAALVVSSEAIPRSVEKAALFAGTHN